MGKNKKENKKDNDPEALKVLGNKAFQARNYHEAVEYYTRAIEMNNKNHIYYANRKSYSVCSSMQYFENLLLPTNKNGITHVQKLLPFLFEEKEQLWQRC